MIIVSKAIAIICYLMAASYQGAFLFSKTSQPPRHMWLLGIGFIAVGAHAISIFNTIYSNQLIDLGFFRVSSLIFWFISLIALLMTLRRPSDNLLVMIFPLAALAVVASALASPVHSIHKYESIGMVGHILTSILAYAVLTIAALQAVTLALQERQLKHRHIDGILKALPPLQTMETILFETIWVGVIMLTISIISGVIFIDNIFAQHLVHKTVLSMVAWLVFSILLWGRHRLGWRSQTAVRWTISGFILLMLGYFGSKLVLEIILQRS